MAGRPGVFFFIQVIGTLISRVSGYVRQVVQNMILGAGITQDLFIAGLQVPNLLRALFAEEAIKAAFLPVLKRYHHQASPEDFRVFLQRFRQWLVMLLGGVSMAVVLGMPYLTAFFFSGFTAEEQAVVTQLARIATGMLIFVGLSGYVMTCFYGMETNAGHWVTSLCPIAFNGSVVVCGLASLWHPAFRLELFAFGIVLGGFGQLLVQLPFLGRIRNTPPTEGATTLDPKAGLKEVRQQWWPAALGAAVLQINVSVDRFLASFLETGGITALYNAARLFQLPTGVLGVSTAVSIHASLARAHDNGDREAFRRDLSWGLGNVLFFAVPLTVVFAVAGSQVCVVLFEYYNFGPEGVRRVALCLSFYAIGIVAYCSNQVLRTAYSAIKDVSARAWIDGFSVASNIGLNLGFLYAFRELGREMYPALALGLSCSALLQMTLYVNLLKSDRRLGRDFRLGGAFWRETIRVVLCSAGMAGVGVGLLQVELPLEVDFRVVRAVELALVVAGMGATYLLGCGILGVRHMTAITKRLRRIVRR